MKFIGRVSLFCIIGIIGVILGICGNRVYQGFYPNRVKEQQIQRYRPDDASESEIPSEEAAESLLVDSQPEAVINCDTAFIIEEYDKKRSFFSDKCFGYMRRQKHPLLINSICSSPTFPGNIFCNQPVFKPSRPDLPAKKYFFALENLNFAAFELIYKRV